MNCRTKQLQKCRSRPRRLWDVCILFTAHDAHLRDYQIIVPSDCVASNFKRETTVALANMKKATHALVCESPMIHFSQGKVRTTSGRVKALPRAA
jgi:hypothetical protein